nr:NAD-binding protein [Sinorhizobium meliloti]
MACLLAPPVIAFSTRSKVVVGGASTAVQDALHLSNLASKVTVVHPSTSLPSRVDPAGQPLGSKLRLNSSGTE